LQVLFLHDSFRDDIQPRLQAFCGVVGVDIPVEFEQHDVEVVDDWFL